MLQLSEIWVENYCNQSNDRITEIILILSPHDCFVGIIARL